MLARTPAIAAYVTQNGSAVGTPSTSNSRVSESSTKPSFSADAVSEALGCVPVGVKTKLTLNAAAFIKEKQDEYAAGIDVFKIANENAVEVVVPANDLRAELITRFNTYRRRARTSPARHLGVTPV